nr:vegetative incompatibility protein het-e-1 [Quercus suber]
MRLLQYDDTGRVSFTKNLSEDELPNYRYSILSHTWGSDEEEVTYEDVLYGVGTSKPGIGSEKIRFCIEQTRRDGLDFFWVDTCCIDKRNLVELSRALISMFRWYSNAEKCYAFLSDVVYSKPTLGEEQALKHSEEAFRGSRWFTRGWTLQELLAPRSLSFFSNDGHHLGTKSTLRQIVSEVTNIPVQALDGQPLATFTIGDRLSWQENRQTKEEEDIVYSLQGIFDISMPVLYGEGKARAQARLSALLEQPEVLPTPSSNVPFRRDPNFVERPALTEQIDVKLMVPSGRVALVGLGGVGKSQLAIEYTRRLRQRSPQTWVFWIHASNAARFEQSVRDVADQLRLHGRKDPKTDHLRLLQDWLRDDSKGSWLIVLDNVDDANFLLEPQMIADEAQLTQRRLDYIPSCDHGSVMITTRSRSEALKMRLYNEDVVSVMPMSEDEAEMLLVSKLGYRSAEGRQLVQALERMPLAITQAAAYIRERTPRYSVQQYCEDIERNRESRIRLLQRDLPIANRDAEASNSVMLTWQISFEHIYQTQRSAAELLSLMSFCDRLAIPESLLRIGSADADSLGSSSIFEDDIVTIRNFSFVSETADPGSWEMHRLVQDATQVWLDDHSRFNDVLDRFINHLYTSFPSGSFENWSLCRRLFPHATNAIECQPVGVDARIEWASVMYNAAWFAYEQGLYDSALTMARCSQTARSEQLGEDDEATLWSTAMVANIYRNQGQLDEAETLEVEVMEVRRAKLGSDHPDTLTSIAHLAETYRDQGRWEEAERLQVNVMKTSREKLGLDHPDTLTSMMDLAATYRDQGRWQEAERLEVTVTETRREKLGPDHLDTLASMANLASTYWNQGRWEEAERLEVKVVEMRREKLGPDHPFTLTSTNNLAETYRDQGRWEEAERLQMQVMETRRVKLGPDHPDTLTSMANLALTYWTQERWEEAERLEVKVMEIRREKLGPDHPDTLTSMANLASTYLDQGRREEAERLQVEVMETRRVKLGPYHPDTLTSMNNLAVTYKRQQRWVEAEDLQMQAVDGYKKSYSPQHPNTLKVIATLGNIQRDREEHRLKMLQQNLALGSNSSDEIFEQTGQKSRRQWLRKLRDKRHR